MPKRIQLSRKKGWRKPQNAVVVSRPGKWGNPFLVQEYGQEGAVAKFRESIGQPNSPLGFTTADLEELRGKDLACWCNPRVPCHADVLLELANA